MKSKEECNKIIDQILKTWNPSLKSDVVSVTGVQTSSMITFAYVMGDDFSWEKLSEVQINVIKQGLRVFRDV